MELLSRRYPPPMLRGPPLLPLLLLGLRRLILPIAPCCLPELFQLGLLAMLRASADRRFRVRLPSGRRGLRLAWLLHLVARSFASMVEPASLVAPP